MEVHNLMEDLVLRLVDDICFEAEAKTGERYCTSLRCKQDIACFVLNRVPPAYVSSARGLAYTDKLIAENAQLTVDIMTLIHEGLNRVSQVQRPYYTAPDGMDTCRGPVYNFPTIKGRFLNSLNFEPLTDGMVEILFEGRNLPMIDPRWQNPFTLNAKIAGSFLFLPRPLPADSVNEKRSFDLEISYVHPRFEDSHHFFSLELVAEQEPDLVSRKTGEYRLPNLFAAPL